MLPLIKSGWCSSLSKMEKAFWTLISLIALAVLIYEWVVVIRDYVDHPVRSNVVYKEPKRMRFPSLLFCHRQFYLNESEIGGNVNDQPGQNVARYMRIVTNPTGADVSSSNGGVAFSSEQEQTKAQADYLAYVSRYHNNPWAAFERIMLSCPDTIKQCSLGAQNYTSAACCQQWAVRRLTPVGPCLALQPPDQEVPSSSGGFQVDFELAANAYSFASNFGGFDLYVGDVIGKPMSSALTLLDEDSYTVQLAATTYENNIDRECNRGLEPSFHQLDLVGMDQAMRCTANAVQKLCQCTPIYKIQLDAVEAAAASQQGAQFQQFGSVGDIDSGANYQIQQGTYQFCDLNNVLRCAAPLLNSTRDQSNFTQVAQRLLGSIPCDTRPPCADNRYHFAVTEFREMTPVSSSYRSRLRLYYESFVQTQIDQRQSYAFHDVIVNMGGAMTFWFVVVHILIYLVTALKYCCCWCCGGGNGDEAHEPIMVINNGRNKVADIEVPINVHKIVEPGPAAVVVDETKDE